MSALCLKHKFHALIHYGKLPTLWKLAHVTPGHKGGDKVTAHDYCSLPLTNVLCKIIRAQKRTYIITHHIGVLSSTPIWWVIMFEFVFLPFLQRIPAFKNFPFRLAFITESKN